MVPSPEALLDLRYQWHPRLREEWAHERLYFWWLSGFASYDRTEIVEKLRWALAFNNVSAFAIYELYGGGYDILLRAWLSTTQRPFSETLERLFGSTLTVEHFSVEDVVAHWPWMDSPATGMRQPDADALARPMEPAEIRRINAREMTPEQAHAFERRNVIAPAPHEQGIKFVTLISPNSDPRSFYAWAQLQRQLLRILGAADSISERSLYKGSGFGRFLIMGRVPYASFHMIATQLTEPINDEVAPATFGARTTTFIVSTEDFLEFADEMHLPSSTPPQRPLAALLTEEESQLLEVKGSAFVDLNRWLATGKTPEYSDRIVDEGVLKAVVGMLNADGGTVVVGALEHERYADREQLAGYPRCGGYICIGVEHDYLGRSWDAFELRLRQLIETRISGNTAERVRIRRDGSGAQPMCIIDVTAPERRKGERNRWYYHLPEGKRTRARFLVREGNRTRELHGDDIDDYKDDRAR